MSESAGSLTFRAHNTDDIPFILNSWGNSYYKGVNQHKHLSPEEFHEYHRPIRARFFSKPNTCCIVCTPDDDPWLILGWIAVEKIPSGLILQYLYVKSAFKTQGIADQLIKRAIPTSPVFFTHLTDRAEKIMRKKGDGFMRWYFCPHLI